MFHIHRHESLETNLSALLHPALEKQIGNKFQSSISENISYLQITSLFKSLSLCILVGWVIPKSTSQILTIYLNKILHIYLTLENDKAWNFQDRHVQKSIQYQLAFPVFDFFFSLLFSSPLSLFFFFFLNGKYSKQYRDYNSKALLGECNRSDFQWEVNRFFSYIKEWQQEKWSSEKKAEDNSKAQVNGWRLTGSGIPFSI